jgi:hypothetical protein
MYMSNFEQWQRELEEAAALSVTADSTAEKPPLSQEDQAVHDLCTGFSEADLLAFEAAGATEAVSLPEAQTDRFPIGFSKRTIASTSSVEEAYHQLLGIADELCEDLVLRHWDICGEQVLAYINQVRMAHDSGQLAGLASSVTKSLSKFKHVCEMLGHGAAKIQRTTADVGELFFLTALSADELRRALCEVYDC